MRGLFILLSLCIASMVYGQEKPNPKPDTKAQQATPAQVQRGTEKAPSVIQILPQREAPQPTQNATSRSEPSHDNWGNRSEFWVMVFTGLVAIFTLGLAIYTACLFGATKRLTERTEATTKIQERAYVYASPTGKPATADKHLQMMVSNFGKTPAYVDRVAFRAVPHPGGDWSMPGDDDFRGVNVLRLTVPPGKSHEFEIAVDFLALKDKTQAFYGRTFFRDVFNDNWSTAWAFRVEPSEGWAAYPARGQGTLRFEGHEPESEKK